MGKLGGHAVVVGASVGGLTAAQVLSSKFEQVTVVDRDSLPATAEDRRGVPQSPHAHALLIRGRMALEQLFPGLFDELVGGGAVPFDPGDDLLFFQMGALRVRFPSGMLGTSCTRAFLETTIRRRVAALPNVEIRDLVSVDGLTGVDGHVTGVVLYGGEVLAADLVVDATGRSGTRSDPWLDKLGCPAPEVTTVKIDVGYTTRLFHRKPGDLPDGALLYLCSERPPHEKRAAAAFAVEGDRWVVTLGGWHRHHAPIDPAGFAEFAGTLPFPHLADLVDTAKPVSDGDARKFHYPMARRRYFEKLRTLPAGYVALGDAICSFNPLYGQGMTVAALEAIALGRCLDRYRTASAKMARDYYRAAGKAIDVPWQMSTGSDFMYPETEGRRPIGTGLVNRYVRQVMLASHVSPEVHRVILGVQHLMAPPAALFRPATVVRALRAARRSPAR
ncbi:FAD-dependent oxidoreductase [Streptosporangium sp. LJ11]|uniref:FAD-dependent oxidoreductase n=1 Tax=Streptosporangium sp. LJ11 TaxID=3436927 RepID=UPI003F7B0BAB